MEYETLLFDVRDNVATITLNRDAIAPLAGRGGGVGADEGVLG